jgi:hypothetical protein
MIRVEQDMPRGLMAAGGGEDGSGTGGVAGEGVGHEIALSCLTTPAFVSGSAWKYQKAEPRKTLQTGLADPIISSLLAPGNDAYNTALQVLRNRNLAGRFWSL